jgi:hypothetical protein
MFPNISDLLNKLKTIKEAIKTGSLDKIGDVIEDFSKLFGYAAYGIVTDDFLDALAEKNYKKAGNAVGDLIKLISENLPSGNILWVTPPSSADFGVPLTTTGTIEDQSATPHLDKAIAALSAYETDPEVFKTMAGPGATVDPKTGLPIAVWILIAQAGFELFKIIRERRKAKPIT